MNTIYSTFVDKIEANRISRLQFLDELEEYFIMQSHYCIVCAVQTKDPSVEQWWKNISLNKIV